MIKTNLKAKERSEEEIVWRSNWKNERTTIWINYKNNKDKWNYQVKKERNQQKMADLVLAA